MNRTLFVLLAGFAFGVTPAAAQDAQRDSTEQVAPAAHPDIVMRVDGLACPFCAHGLERKLDALEATDSVEIRLNEGLVLLYLRDEHSVSDEALTKAVTNAGFVVRAISRHPPTEGTD